MQSGLLMNANKLFTSFLYMQNSAFLELDELFYRSVQNEQPPHSSGSTVLAAFLQGSQLHIANAGDSRAVVCKRGRPEPMSHDHRPGSRSEQDRIEHSGAPFLLFNSPAVGTIHAHDAKQDSMSEVSLMDVLQKINTGMLNADSSNFLQVASLMMAI